MPELPDITVYIDVLTPRVVGRRLTAARVKSPFLVRTFEPAIDSLVGSRVVGIERLGKRLVFCFEHERFLVLHLMIAGRLLWKAVGVKPGGKIDLAALEFSLDDPGSERANDETAAGTLLITEAGTKKRASIHIVEGRGALRELDPGGVEPLTCTLAAFTAALRLENRTLKRVLTSPARFSGIGNAYSDEILHAAGLSPVARTHSLDDAAIARLYHATRHVLVMWIGRLREEFGLMDSNAAGAPGDAAPASNNPSASATKGTGRKKSPPAPLAVLAGSVAPPPDLSNASPGTSLSEDPITLPACTSPGRFPKVREITAFRPDFAVHGKYGVPCPLCGSIVQRIVRADNEINYCATCQTGGKLLADRSLSRLLKDDWPATIEEWEAER